MSEFAIPQPEEHDYDAFLVEIDELQEAEEILATIELRFRDFLETRGEQFADNIVLPELTTAEQHELEQQEMNERFEERMAEIELTGAVIDEAVIEDIARYIAANKIARIHEEGVRVDNRRELLHLVLSKAKIDVVYTNGGSSIDASPIKKEHMATMLAKGKSRAWLDLIEKEFPGEGLLPEEEPDYVARILFEREVTYQKVTAVTESYYQDMVNYWHTLNNGVLPEALERTVRQLAGLKTIAQAYPNRNKLKDIYEDVRLLLINSGLNDEYWKRFVDYFFNMD